MNQPIRGPMSEDQIAKLLGITRQSVYVVLERARMKLKREILKDREACALMREVCGRKQ